jgi:hypothetical protein
MFTALGSLEALHAWCSEHPDVSLTVLTTAAVFTGVPAALSVVAAVTTPGTVVDCRSRGDALDEALVALVTPGATVLCLDGSPLHARSVWRQSALEDRLRQTHVVAVGSVASVFGTTMVDPRGGAPTTGLGWFDDVVFTVPTSTEQAERTASLVGPALTLVQLESDAEVTLDGHWTVRGTIEATRAGQPVTL